MSLYAVLGNPIDHSLSPQIHADFAAQFDIKMEYRRVLVPSNQFVPTLGELKGQGLHGCNVTVPCKLDAFLAADNLTTRAHAAGAVNTVHVNKSGGIIGHNTDGDGFIADIMGRHGVSITDQRILIIGAGGATQGILQPIMELHPKLVTIANRTREKAVLLEERFKDMGPMDACSLNDIPTKPYNLIINATSMGYEGSAFNIPASVIGQNTFVYDLSYGKAAENVLGWARHHNARCADGLGMLVEQAALSFALWHGQLPDTAPIYKALR